MHYLHRPRSALTTLLTGASMVPLDVPVNPLSALLLRFEITRAAPAACC